MIQKLTQWMMEKTLTLEPSMKFDELTLHILDHSRMIEINQAVFGRDYPTDVISQCYAPLPGDQTQWEGEVFINLELAVEDAKTDDEVWTQNHEFALYIAHGCHHLIGAEDDTPEKKTDMLTLETEWVHQADQEGLIGPLL